MGKLIDLTGQRFGHWTVLYRDLNHGRVSGNAFWICRCDCGTIRSVNGASLKSGGTKSCGCVRDTSDVKKRKTGYVDLTGRRFGRLTVIERVVDEKRKRPYWRCLCDCGNECVVRGQNLTGGHTKSCGCYMREKAGAIHVVDLTGQRFGRLVVLERVGSSSRKEALWRCRCDCGGETTVRGHDLRNGTTQSCGCIGHSRGEWFVDSYLRQAGIQFSTQVRYYGLNGVGEWPLSYDFAIKHPSFGVILVEYNGEQHYSETNGWHSTLEHFERQQEHDERKRQAAELLGYPLIEIPYTYDTQEKVNQYLDDMLAPLLQRPVDEWEYVEQDANE